MQLYHNLSTVHTIVSTRYFQPCNMTHTRSQFHVSSDELHEKRRGRNERNKDAGWIQVQHLHLIRQSHLYVPHIPNIYKDFCCWKGKEILILLCFYSVCSLSVSLYVNLVGSQWIWKGLWILFYFIQSYYLYSFQYILLGWILSNCSTKLSPPKELFEFQSLRVV